jgi:hypothetical protein
MFTKSTHKYVKNQSVHFWWTFYLPYFAMKHTYTMKPSNLKKKSARKKSYHENTNFGLIFIILKMFFLCGFCAKIIEKFLKFVYYLYRFQPTHFSYQNTVIFKTQPKM